MCEITEHPGREATGGYSASELPGSVAGVDTVVYGCIIRSDYRNWKWMAGLESSLYLL